MRKMMFAIAAVLLITSACKKDKKDTPAPGSNVDNVKLSITKVNTPVALHNVKRYTAFLEMHNGAIYVANGFGNDAKQFFDKYDLATNTFTPLDTPKNLCHCGYSSKLVSDKDNRLFYIANQADYYSVSANKWYSINFPPNAANNIGEAGAISMNDKMYYIGGREPSTAVKYFDVKLMGWYNASDFPYPTNRCDGVAVNGKMYVFGGEGGKNRFSIYDAATNAWTVKDTMNFNFTPSYDQRSAGVIGQYIFLKQSKNVYVYDITNDKWATAPIVTSLSSDNGYNYQVFSSGDKLYFATQNPNEDFQLYQAVINQ